MRPARVSEGIIVEMLHWRCKCSMDTSQNLKFGKKIKLGNKILFGNKIPNVSLKSWGLHIANKISVSTIECL